MPNDQITALTFRMLEYEQGCPKRSHHFLKVLTFARIIGQEEKINQELLFILETSALVHDVGIRASLAKLGYYNARLQQTEGPPVAENLLNELGFEQQVIERVSYLVAHHHTYRNIQGLDYQILVEADFLVNIFERGMQGAQIQAVKEQIFQTKTGLALLASMYENS